MVTFEAFPKIARLNRNCVITEKLDGTNAQVIVTEDGEVAAACRTRLITPEDDNYGFARWVEAHKDELRELGPGRHFGEWWGAGIQRKYGLKGSDKRFSLFNVSRWSNLDPEGPRRPDCCDVVPVLYSGPFKSEVVDMWIERLRTFGSQAVPGFMKPEGLIVWHEAARQLYKVTCEKDEKPKGLAEAA